MCVSRRNMLLFAGGGCALVLLPVTLRASSSLCQYEVRDTVALPRFNAGDVVIADSGVHAFAGDGLYLYPSWGQPRLYEVRALADRLEFRNPGSGQLLWTQSHALAAFAGKVVDAAQTGRLLAELPVLAVPTLPPLT